MTWYVVDIKMISTTFVHQAKIHRHTAFGENFAIQFQKRNNTTFMGLKFAKKQQFF